jgi:hypothetical protein
LQARGYRFGAPEEIRTLDPTFVVYTGSLILLVVVGNSVLLQDADSTRISSISSLRIGTHFGNSPELWLNPQQDYDL